MKEHRWSGWPGAYCLDCGIEDVMEFALFCSKCQVPTYPGEYNDVMTLCPEHKEWANTPCKETE